MKKKLLFSIILFACLKISAEESYKLNVHFKIPLNEKIQVGTKMDYQVYLVNNSGQETIIYDPKHKDVENRTYGLFKSDYKLYFNNDSIDHLYWFVEGAHRNFRRNAEVKVKNGDSILIDTGQLQPMRIGEYKFVFMHRQVKEKFSEHVLKTIGKDIDKVASFDLASDSIRFTTSLDIKKDEKKYTYEELNKIVTDPTSVEWAVKSNSNLFNLKKLILKLDKDNKQSYELIPYLKNVQWIDIELVNGDSIPKELAALENLIYLNIKVVKKDENKNMPFIPVPNIDMVGNFKKLEYLNLSSTFSEEHLKWIENLSYLRYLYMRNGPRRYDVSLNKLTQLEDLYLTGCKEAELPVGIFNLPKLKKLTLGLFENPLPEKLFTQLPALEELIFTVHKSAGQLDLTGCNPKILNLDLRQSNVYPKGLKDMTNLENLLIDGNFGNQPFPDLSQSKINRLEIISKDMTIMPENIGNIKTLNWLIFRTPKLASIDPIGNCTGLKKFFIYQSSLGDNISENLLKCNQIDVLSIRNSGITRFGAIAKMNWLRVLYLEENKITKIPDEIAGFTNLESIWLQDNQLIDFYDAMLQLPKIETISLRKNPLAPSVINRYKADIEANPKLKKLLLIDLK